MGESVVKTKYVLELARVTYSKSDKLTELTKIINQYIKQVIASNPNPLLEYVGSLDYSTYYIYYRTNYPHHEVRVITIADNKIKDSTLRISAESHEMAEAVCSSLIKKDPMFKISLMKSQEVPIDELKSYLDPNKINKILYIGKNIHNSDDVVMISRSKCKGPERSPMFDLNILINGNSRLTIDGTYTQSEAYELAYQLLTAGPDTTSTSEKSDCSSDCNSIEYNDSEVSPNKSEISKTNLPKNNIKSFDEFRALTGGVFSIPQYEALKNMGFFKVPASVRYHYNTTGGLWRHSQNVARNLVTLTNKLGLKWSRPESPYIVGILHDLCKIDNYVFNETEGKWDYSHDITMADHGAKSVILASRLVHDLTEEEMLCIRWHMGAFDDKSNWEYFTKSIHKYPNVLYTHTADMMAAHIDELED